MGGLQGGQRRAPHFPADVELPVDFMLMFGRCTRATDKNPGVVVRREATVRRHSLIAIIYLRRRRTDRPAQWAAIANSLTPAPPRGCAAHRCVQQQCLSACNLVIRARGEDLSNISPAGPASGRCNSRASTQCCTDYAGVEQYFKCRHLNPYNPAISSYL